MLHPRSSNLLEAEAADYFKLNLGQVHLLSRSTSSDLLMARARHSGRPSETKQHKPRPAATRAPPSKAAPPSIGQRAWAPADAYPKPLEGGGTWRVSPRNYHQDHHQAQAPPSQAYCNPSALATCSQFAAGSSTTSTNSLPSISSSPSVSPSLVCPHLSLDDILASPTGAGSRVSPHTIGLCARCRLDPPPNVQSPLSPVFRPSAHLPNKSAQQDRNGSPNRPHGPDTKVVAMRRAHSDHQASCYSKSGRRQLEAASRHQLRDDSLDYYLEPNELRRLQMSPTLRNSVEFIRNNSIEPGRVVRIYKNGRPFDKPLRVSILRAEFATLNHLLDHINSRQLIPCGARYLFHLDGQLVYSVHELKHGSVYIVSGTRSFDHRANAILKGQQKRDPSRQPEQAQPVSQVQPAATPAGRRRLDQAPARQRHAPSSSGAPGGHVGQAGRPARRASLSETREPVGAARRTATTGQAGASPGSVARRHQLASGPAPGAGEPTRSSGLTVSGASWRDELANNSETTGLAVDSGERPDKKLVAPASEQSDGETLVRPTRAKSELSALPSKRKKNVTFVDTGRGRSPSLIGETTAANGTGGTPPAEKRADGSGAPDVRPAPEHGLTKALSTNEIGIQVSDSIDGFLIDLPMPIPARGDDANLNRYRPAAGRGGRRPGAPQRSRRAARLSGEPAPGPNGPSRKGVPAAAAGKPRQSRGQIVTITERQLSLDEMSQLKDLDHGDHHNESARDDAAPRIAIVLDEQPAVGGETLPGKTQPDEAPAGRAPDHQEANGQARAQSPDRLAGGAADDDHWQYPGGRASSATPTERPVSQSGPSESVRARVSTPTGAADTGARPAPHDPVRQHQRAPAQVGGSLPPKQRTEVRGKLCAGIHAPTKNFRLVWVNGFTINDQYPDNCLDAQQLADGTTGAGSSPTGVRPESTDPGGGAPDGPARLAPSCAPRPSNHQPTIPFKPSERFHNWVCHSRQHNELIYPAGTLVVLWCKWTNEQRYYARHTTSVTTVALSTLDPDLAASAQTYDSSERPPASANVHLWSLATLSTLLVVDDDQFRAKRIFSLRLKNTPTSGCELSVAARDDKQLALFTFTRRIGAADESPTKGTAHQADALEKVAKRAKTSEPAGVLRASKPLATNQSPMLVVPLPSVEQQQAPVQQQQPSVLLSFGRRHFHLWSADHRHQKLRQMQPEAKSAKFAEMVAKANCLARLSPTELLVGGMDGNIVLLVLSYHKHQLRAPIASGKSGPDELKYSVETVLLSSGACQQQPAPPVTCLVRISGSLFISADSTCTVRFWRIKRKSGASEKSDSSGTVKLQSNEHNISCHQLAAISLPSDLGLICSLVLAQYNRKQSSVDFYAVSASNTILFGSVQLQAAAPPEVAASLAAGADALAANCSLSLVYEGHQTAATSLAADFAVRLQPNSSRHQEPPSADADDHYFTCSLDCRICKWAGRQLLWKSLLPSPCASLAIHPVGFVLAAGSTDGTVYILDKISGLLISYFPLTPVRINCLAYSRDGALLAAGCANGSIFILPVYERGLKYKKVSIFQSPHPVVSLQFSMDNRYILTSVTHGSYQELILWDLPNFRYMRDNVKLAADKIQWFDSICSGSEDVRAIWENANLIATTGTAANQEAADLSPRRPTTSRRAPPPGLPRQPGTVINLSCHRLVRKHTQQVAGGEPANNDESFVIASDTSGYLRLFRYPCYDIQQGFYAIRISSSAVNCCRFLNSKNEPNIISSSIDGSICLWKLE